jgi:hypothetical protein
MEEKRCLWWVGGGTYIAGKVELICVSPSHELLSYRRVGSAHFLVPVRKPVLIGWM